MQQKIPGIRYEIGLYSKRIGVFRGLSATIQQSSHFSKYNPVIPRDNTNNEIINNSSSYNLSDMQKAVAAIIAIRRKVLMK